MVAEACTEGRGEVCHVRGDKARLGRSEGRGAAWWSRRVTARTRSSEAGAKCCCDGEAACGVDGGVGGGGCCPSPRKRLKASAAKYVEVRQAGAVVGGAGAANGEVTSRLARGDLPGPGAVGAR
ncbi:hypothetical protein ZWY2020_056547 [Hordeum vulgare]|nr:hypothetical protein ZWY2020_056547 [Hordeum vulgare]